MQCTEELDAHAVVGALYGLRGMADSTEARGLLSALTPKIERCSEELDARAAAYALQTLPDLPGVGELKALVESKLQQGSGSESSCESGEEDGRVQDESAVRQWALRWARRLPHEFEAAHGA
jgi:hypothetical protein